MMPDTDTIIIGGGLAGLCCARELHRCGHTFVLLEAADEVGGRVRTDVVDGYLLDRGFQVLLTSYPEARAVLDSATLDLHHFYAGALIRTGHGWRRIADPWRHPLDALASAFKPIATISDIPKVAALRRQAMRGSLDELFARPQIRAIDRLRGLGLSDAVIEQFFRPFLGGVFLERELTTSTRVLEFVVRMFATGVAALPAEGMGAIPRQLAAALSVDSIRLNTAAASVEPGRVELTSGESLRANHIVVATDLASAATLLPGRITRPQRWNGTICLSFAANQPPVDEPILILNGCGSESGPINHLCIPSQVAPAYAPPGRTLISANVVGVPDCDDASLEGAARAQLRGWFGDAVEQWRCLRIDRFPRALPAQDTATMQTAPCPIEIEPGLLVCGDHLGSTSIQNAMASGRRAAQRLITARARAEAAA